jgi:hypothetical protein
LRSRGRGSAGIGGVSQAGDGGFYTHGVSSFCEREVWPRRTTAGKDGAARSRRKQRFYAIK